MTDMFGAPVPLIPATGWIHLQFLRFAGCPICNLHLRAFTGRREDIAAAGVDEVLVFHSSAEELAKYESELPFPTIADPEKHLYALFGVEKSAKAIANPKVWGSVIKGMAADTNRARKGEAPMPPVMPRNGELGLPADFLIDPSGTIRAVRYGTHAGDQWTVDELLALASSDDQSPHP